jgi:hypothetical protein
MATPGPTYYRHRNEDLKHEIVIHDFVPDEGDRWSITMTADFGFEPWTQITMRTGEYTAFRKFGEFFDQLAERQPGTLDEVAAILDGLGVRDETAERQRQRAESDAALARHVDDKDPWPYL